MTKHTCSDPDCDRVNRVYFDSLLSVMSLNRDTHDELVKTLEKERAEARFLAADLELIRETCDEMAKARQELALKVQELEKKLAGPHRACRYCRVPGSNSMYTCRCEGAMAYKYEKYLAYGRYEWEFPNG